MMNKKMKIGILFLALFVVLGSFNSNVHAQSNASQLYYDFKAVSVEGCGTGTINFNGHSIGYAQSMGWSVLATDFPNYNTYGGYLDYSWTLTDEAGTLASGSYNSSSGASTGGTFGVAIDTSTQRFPVGDVEFRAFGTVIGDGISGLCSQYFDATTYASYTGNGYSDLRVNPSPSIRFQNKQSNYFLQVNDYSDYSSATQGISIQGGNQYWTLSRSNLDEGHYFTNSATGKRLYSDFLSSNSLVYQLSGANRSWKLVSVGDGTSFYIVYEYNNGGTQYAMEPVGGSTSNGAAIEALSRQNRQSQKWIIIY